jgi:hypothetical protein
MLQQNGRLKKFEDLREAGATLLIAARLSRPLGRAIRRSSVASARHARNGRCFPR